MFAAGNSVSSSEPNYIESVFSTYLYTGNGSTQTITNGIDLAGKGGLVWGKSRSNAYDNFLADSVRGSSKLLYSNNTYAEQTDANVFSSFNSNGFSLGIGGAVSSNTNGATYVSWTFREQPKFFDVVTYTGTGAGNTITHNLGSKPGCIIIKRTDSTGDWFVVSRKADNDYALFSNTGTGLNNTAAANSSTAGGDFSATTINIGALNSSNNINASGGTYVAYLFAHNAGGFGLDGTDNVISCGSFTTNGSGAATINLGYEPQFVLYKPTTVSNWYLFDTMRGMSITSGKYLQPDTSNAEGSANYIVPNSTGFTIGSWNPSETSIYIAIRRGPMKVPTLGTSVFAPIARTGTGATANVTGVGFPPDLVIPTARTVGWQRGWYDRLRGVNQSIASNSAGAELTTADSITVFGQDGATYGTEVSVNASTYTFANWFMRRAPSFFDEVCYTGTGVATTFAHNLTVVPELMIVKGRSIAEEWNVYYGVNTKYLKLNSTDIAQTATTRWNDTSPTSSVFTVGTSGWVNQSGSTYVAYLFATATGVSKVGSYTGTGALQTVACGFTSGARFVLIKRADAVGDWYVWDSARGISSGTDPYLLLNSTAAEVTVNNYVDTDTTGFKVTAAAPAALNAVGGTYIFLAIA